MVPLFCINHPSEEGTAGRLFLLQEIHRGKLSSGHEAEIGSILHVDILLGG